MHLRALAIALAALATLLLPGALAQDAPVLIERVDEEGLLADVGSPAQATFRLFNLNPADDFYVSVSVESPRAWNADAQPTAFFVGPRNTTDVTVTFAPDVVPRSAVAEFTVTFSLVNGRSGEVTHVPHDVSVGSSAAPLVLGIFPNPLGSPLDNAYGTFLLDMAFWIVVGVASVVAGDALVRMIATRASNATVREMVQKLRRPIFLFVLFLGLAQSFAVLPRNPFIVLVEKLLVAVAVTVFGLYVLYRLLDVALVYYQRELSQRTATKVDDILVPVLRKVGLVVIYAAGTIITLQRLGWDPTIVFAGAGIAGLVIAFAAQDTISNLFSGIFLLVDRPFTEGDDIRLESGDVAKVEAIGLRTTRLYIGRTHETVILPNNSLAQTRVVNLTGPDRRYWIMVNIGTSYDADPEHVRRVLLQVAAAHPQVTREADWAPLVLFADFADSSLNFVLRCGVEDYRQRFLVASDLRFAIVQAFEREGIEIPFPQRVLHIKDPEKLRPLNQNP